MTSYVTQEQYEKSIKNIKNEFGNLSGNSTEVSLSINSFSNEEKEEMAKKIKLALGKILNNIQFKLIK